MSDNMTAEQKNFQNTVEILRRQREAQSDLVVQLNVQVLAQNEYINSLNSQIAAFAEKVETLEALVNKVQSASTGVSTIDFTPVNRPDTVTEL